MRSFFRRIFLRPVLWLVRRYSSHPDKDRVFSALSALKHAMENQPGKKGFVIPFNSETQRFIIFSDQHKGRKNGADDFALSEENYIAALNFYDSAKFHLIALGDCEELWENTLLQVMKYNVPSFNAEKRFVVRDAFTKIVGNHDLDWVIDPIAPTLLKKIYGVAVPVLEGVMLETTVAGKVLKFLCTHGHQGDKQSDGNWFSKFFVTKVWAPLQAFLQINPNTPAFDQELKTEHNRMMYEWALHKKDLILITGHTHQPVFESLTHYERLQKEHLQTLKDLNPEWAEAVENELKWTSAETAGNYEHLTEVKSVYFNTGCCCFVDGDITGIEISDGHIRLIQWEKTNAVPTRSVLREISLEQLARSL